MSTTETPAALLRRAAERARELAEAAEADLYSNPYWGIGGRNADECYRSGIVNATGGPAGDLAASWDLSSTRAAADLFDKVAWMGELDPDMLARVGCDEVIALARAFLNETPEIPAPDPLRGER